MNITPDWVYRQAYTSSLEQGADRHFMHKEHGTPWETSAFHLGLFPAIHRETLKMTFQGKLIRAKIHKLTDQPHKNHRRGKITDFSAQSRGRLFDLFNSMDIRKPVIFITLTYLSEDIDCELAKAQLRAFIKRLQRLHASSPLAFIWRMEFQERGAIHFHVMAFNLPFTPKEQIQAMWGEIICQVKPFTRIEMIYSSRKVMNYVSKYVAKVNPGGNSGFNSLTYLSAYQQKHGDEIGRCWGVRGSKFLPMAELIEFEVPFTFGKFMKFKELCATIYPPIMDSYSPGFKLYVMSARAWEGYFHTFYDEVF